MAIQILLSLLSSISFLIINSYLGFFSSVYGSLISLINAYLIRRISIKQQKIEIHNSSVGLKIMVISVISRLILIALLVLIGFKLGLEPLALLASFGIAQVGFLIDTIGIKNGK